ncbi:MAG: serine hydrolase [Bacteroidota bacterium]
MMSSRFAPLLGVLLLLTSCTADEPAQADSAMVFPGETWATATAESQGVDGAILQAALDTLAFYSGADGLDEVVVVRNGYVIHQGDSVHKAHNVYSVTKSITSTALVLLVDEGKASLDKPVAEIEPMLAERYPSITFRTLATMRSGYNADGPNRWGEASADWSATPFEVGEPLFAPGSAYAYWDEAMIMMGRVLTRVAGESLYDYLDQRVMHPIGITDWSWWSEHEVDGIPVVYGATGISLNALDLARFGLLYLNDGVWDGTRLLPKHWVAEATINHVPATIAIADTDRSATDGRGIYGFNWWTNGVTPDGTRSMPDAPVGTYYASGLHNNMLFVVPEWDLLLVRRGEDGNPPAGKANVYNRVLRTLAPGITV